MTPAGAVLPFPFAALPAFSREELLATRHLRDVGRGLVRLDRLAEALSELVGQPIELALRRAQRADATTLPEGAIGVALAPADAGTLAAAVVIELDSDLAATLLAGALRQRAPTVADPSRPPATAFAGGTAALVHAAVKRAHAGAPGGPLRVLAAGPAPALARDLAAHAGPIVAASITVTVGTQAGGARVLVPQGALARAPSVPQLVLDRMGELPLALPVIAWSGIAARAELAALRERDVFVVPETGIAADTDGRVFGAVWLAAPRGEKALLADLAEGGGLVIRTGRLATLSWDPPMTNDAAATARTTSAETLEVLEDAPVVVRVELGAVEMSARAWGQLGEGDVIALGRRLGDPAVLRVGGIEVAQGELVQVDGEYGVRILRRGGS